MNSFAAGPSEPLAVVIGERESLVEKDDLSFSVEFEIRSKTYIIFPAPGGVAEQRLSLSSLWSDCCRPNITTFVGKHYSKLLVPLYDALTAPITKCL